MARSSAQPTLSEEPNSQLSSSTNTKQNEPRQENLKQQSISIPQKRNAFTELKWIAPQPKHRKVDNSKQNETKSKHNRDFASALLPYILHPESFPTTTIIRKTEHTVLLRDLFPKALVHLLLLPRDPAFYGLTPFEAFNPKSPSHVAFLDMMRSEARSAAKLAASELTRLVGPHSATCKARNNVLDTLPEPGNSSSLTEVAADHIPPARDFIKDIRIGVHAEPSMNTLHVHIISIDSYSPALKHKKHYNSFNSNFFVPLDDFPLAEDDERMKVEKQKEYAKGDMECWRCGKNYGNRFKELKTHLEDEYHEWRSV
ncbi:aprataxin-like protein [Neophaeococcomyces mojaviensis]|uniref:Aprataxin-like protein n=1 Tax=Neophaeococcomyces mojaviensis TaxID=3383035 RepID=A0ACC2ZX66_9EURO|nr:aprataxin-like protein [Knufia sp. JES_112]